MSFKDDIKTLRRQSNLTQEALAQQLHVTRQTVSTWETGKNMPSLETLHALSQLFNISLEKLLFNEEIAMKKDKEPSLATRTIPLRVDTSNNKSVISRGCFE